MKKITIAGIAMLFAAITNAQITANDASLHAMKPVYTVPYEPMAKEDIKKVLDKVFNYLDAVTPAQMINKKTNEAVTDPAAIDSNTAVKQGDFRITSYEWGVTYSALQWASDITGDKKYTAYVKDRFDFFAKWIPAVRKLKAAGHQILQIYSRNASAASELAYEWDTESTNYKSMIQKNADLYIIAVDDRSIADRTPIRPAAAGPAGVKEPDPSHEDGASGPRPKQKAYTRP